MNKQLYIHIPKPCHEDWHKMTPTQQGRFCQSCAKQVVDFTLMTDHQVLNYFTNNTGKTCGRFAADQLQRPLQPIRQEKKKWWLLAAMMPMLLFFTKGNAQKKSDIKTKQKAVVINLEPAIAGLVDYVYENDDVRLYNDSKVIQKIKVERKQGDPHFIISGQIKDDRNEPVQYATIVIKDSKIGTASDYQGNFMLKGVSDENKIRMLVSSVGFDDKEVNIVLKDTGLAESEKLLIVKGKVFDEKGVPIVGAEVMLKDSKNSASTGAEGHFEIPVQLKNMKQTLVISSVGFLDKIVPVSLQDTAELIIKCQTDSAVLKNLNDIVVGGASACRKPITTDTFPALVQRIFLAPSFKTYPNPAPRGSNVNIEIKNAGTYAIQLFDNTGRLLTVQEFEASNGSMQTSIPIPASFAAGIYYLRLVNDDTKKQYTSKLMVQ